MFKNLAPKVSLKFLISLFVIISIAFIAPNIAFAKKKGGNPPGPTGGPGAGPKWKDNPNKIDNPPGPVGGAGTDFGNSQGSSQGSPVARPWSGNPPGAAGGPGAGPRWTDNPNRTDNPPGPVGGQGTDWKNPPGLAGGPGAGKRK